MNDSVTLASFFEAWELFADAALTSVFAGTLLGFLGVYVVLRRMVFLSAALSQAAGMGVALAFYLHVALGLHGWLGSPTGWAMATTLLAALFLLSDRFALGARKDSLLGFAYLVGAAGALALGTRIVTEVQDIHAILFGSAVAVLPRDLWLVGIMTTLLLALHVWLMRGFIQVSFDRDGAQVRGLPVRLLDTLLLVTLAMAISVSTRVLGALPVFAFSVLPAMAAIRLAPNVPRALLLSAILGACVGFLGYVAAYMWQLPVGASQALVAAGFVVVAELLARLAPQK